MQTRSAEDQKKKERSAPTHPDYVSMTPDWTVMKDVVKGERAVKEAGETYLPMTSGQVRDGSQGSKRYEAYKRRAVYLNFPKGTIKDGLGMMFSRLPDIEVPKSMEYLRTNATPKGEPLADLLENINYEQLRMGRVFLLADIREDTNEIYFSIYKAPSVINWHTRKEEQSPELDYVLLDESDYDFNEQTKAYVWAEKFRVLGLFGGVYYTFTVNAEGLEKINFSDLATLPADAVAPKHQGKPLKEIPGSFINVTHVGADVEDPPLLDQANISLAYYRGDADYRLALYKQAQGTFYGIGFTEDEINNSELRLGADGFIMSSNKDAKVGFAELQGQGIPQMRDAGKDLKQEALSLGVTLFDKAGVESGKALVSRSMVKTASIRTIALTGAEGLVKVIKLASGWVSSADASKIEITPNTDFLDINASPQDVAILHSLLESAGMSLEDYHTYLFSNGYTSKAFEDWQQVRENQMENI